MSAFENPRCGEEIECRIVELFRRYAERFGEERVAEGPPVEHELDVESSAQALLDLGKRRIGEAARFQRRGVDRGGLIKRARGRRHRLRSRRFCFRGIRACARLRGTDWLMILK